MWEFIARSLEASMIFTFAALGELIDQRSGVLGRCRHNNIQVVFSFQSLLNDFHMQQSEEPTAESKPKRFACFRLEFEAGIIDRQPAQCIP